MAEEYGRAVDNYNTVHEQIRVLKGKLMEMEEKLEATPAHTAAGIGPLVFDKVLYPASQAPGLTAAGARNQCDGPREDRKQFSRK